MTFQGLRPLFFTACGACCSRAPSSSRASTPSRHGGLHGRCQWCRAWDAKAKPPHLKWILLNSIEIYWILISFATCWHWKPSQNSSKRGDLIPTEARTPRKSWPCPPRTRRPCATQHLSLTLSLTILVAFKSLTLKLSEALRRPWGADIFVLLRHRHHLLRRLQRKFSRRVSLFKKRFVCPWPSIQDQREIY